MAIKIKPFGILLSLGLVASLATACGGGATDGSDMGTDGTGTPGSVEEAPDTGGTTTMPDTNGTTTAPGTNSTTTPDTTITDPVTPDPATPGVGGSN